MEKQQDEIKNKIVSEYMNTVLDTGEAPKSIYSLTKELNISEREFYQYFSSFDVLEKEIFVIFFENAMRLLKDNQDFNGYNATNKLLSFYFTFIEILTENRSFVISRLQSKKNPMAPFKILDPMKHVFFAFVNELDVETLDLKQEQLEKLQNKGKENIFWAQFMMILKFWIEDHYASFEKTDIFIEKSVHASFDILNIKPVQSFLELGKFLLKEKMNFKM
jgi:AcrR family transcriptional regulator